MDGCAGEAGGAEMGAEGDEGDAGPRGGALLHADSNANKTNTKAKRNGIEEVAAVSGIYHRHGAMPS